MGRTHFKEGDQYIANAVYSQFRLFDKVELGEGNIAGSLPIR